MTKSKPPVIFPPLIFNIFKPARMSSYDVVRHFKRHLPKGYGKIGHFGTLDPFASGVLMIGIAGAARLNEFIHDNSPKTYLAVGKLGVETPTGDYTGEIIQRDDSLYLKQEISRFPLSFLQERISEKFVGDYLQAPHKFSASKFMGRNMHQWAREGVEVKKEPVLRHIYSIKVIKYTFPYLSFEVTASSGTYVRTLFTDICNDLGTIGTLVALTRTQVGLASFRNALHPKDWPQEGQGQIMERGSEVDSILSFPRLKLTKDQAYGFQHGAFLKPCEFDIQDTNEKYYWVEDSEKLLGLAHYINEKEIKPKINFYQDEIAAPSSESDPQ